MLIDGVPVPTPTVVELATVLHQAGRDEIGQRIGWAVDLNLNELPLSSLERHAVIGATRSSVGGLGRLHADLVARRALD